MLTFQKKTEETCFEGGPAGPTLPLSVSCTLVWPLQQRSWSSARSSVPPLPSQETAEKPSARSLAPSLPPGVPAQRPPGPDEGRRTAPLGPALPGARGPRWALGSHVRATPAPDRGPAAPPPPGSGEKRAGGGHMGIPAGRERPPVFPTRRAGGSAPRPRLSPGWRRPPDAAGRAAPGLTAHRKPAPANVRPFYNPLVTHNRPGAFSVKPPASPPSCLFLEPTA